MILALQSSGTSESNFPLLPLRLSSTLCLLLSALFSASYGLFVAFGSFFARPSLCFQDFTDSFAEIPGGRVFRRSTVHTSPGARVLPAAPGPYV